MQSLGAGVGKVGGDKYSFWGNTGIYALYNIITITITIIINTILIILILIIIITTVVMITILITMMILIRSSLLTAAVETDRESGQIAANSSFKSL